MGKDRLNEAMITETDETGKIGESDKPVKTYYLSWELIEHIKRLQDQWNASESAVVRFLLGLGLEAVKKGKQPPMITVTKADLD